MCRAKLNRIEENQVLLYRGKISEDKWAIAKVIFQLLQAPLFRQKEIINFMIFVEHIQDIN